MKMKSKLFLSIAVAWLLLFVLWTVAVCVIDVKPIGPQQSCVGFATLNAFVHDLVGVNMFLYSLTDWLGLVPFCFIMFFAIRGLIQLIKRKRLLSVDKSILVLGGFYILVLSIYVLFEFLTINYRPVLISGVLEKSYPSSTTMLALCVMPTAVDQLSGIIKNKKLKIAVDAAIIVFTVFMVVGRVLSGVHWCSDILGGIFLSAGFDMLYFGINKKPLN